MHEAIGPLCRGLDVPGVYFVRLLQEQASTVLCFRDNWFTGIEAVASDEEIDLELTRTASADALYRLSDRHAGTLPPPWSTSDIGRYLEVPEVGASCFVSVSVVTHSPLGDIEVTTRYEAGRPVERTLRRPMEEGSGQTDPPPDVLISRRFSAILLRAAGIINVLNSFGGGHAEGDWSKLMLLAGIAEGPEMLEANASGRLNRPELAALALFSELWAQGAVPEAETHG